MIKLPNLQDTIVHADSLVNQHALWLFKDIPMDGYSLEFTAGIFSAVKKYVKGREVESYGIEYLNALIPYSWDLTGLAVTDFDCLETYDGEMFSSGVHVKGELFSGYTIEFTCGVFERVSLYENGDQLAGAIWNRVGVISEFGLGKFCVYEFYRKRDEDNNATFLYEYRGASLAISFDERIDVHTKYQDQIYTKIKIEKNPFLYADEFNRDIGLGDVLSMTIFDSIPLVEHLFLSGSGLTKEIVFSLMKNPVWNNVKEITVDSSAINEGNMAKLLSVYPNILIDYLAK